MPKVTVFYKCTEAMPGVGHRAAMSSSSCTMNRADCELQHGVSSQMVLL